MVVVVEPICRDYTIAAASQEHDGNVEFDIAVAGAKLEYLTDHFSSKCLHKNARNTSST